MPTILVIEDEVLIRLAICDYLRGMEYRVVEASTAEEGLRVFRAGEPVEVLFSDIDLGTGMSGLALARWVRRNYPGVRILLTSGVQQDARETSSLSDAPVFSKPYSQQRLEHHIRRLVDAVRWRGT